VGGEEGYNSNRYSKNSNTKLIKSHALDYDLYLNEESNRSDPIVRGNYVVFLDEFVPFHPDYFYRNIKPDCSFEDYYPDINRFFNKIESRFDVKVIIASHPRSNYKKNDNPFNERTCIINETINLVKFSKFVIAHASTATNFAVLYNKPILFITSNKYSTRYKKIIHFHSLVFGNKSINVSSRSINIDTEIKADKILYKNYKQQYIKMPKTPEKQIWEIFADNID